MSKSDVFHLGLVKSDLKGATLAAVSAASLAFTLASSMA